MVVAGTTEPAEQGYNEGNICIQGVKGTVPLANSSINSGNS